MQRGEGLLLGGAAHSSRWHVAGDHLPAVALCCCGRAGAVSLWHSAAAFSRVSRSILWWVCGPQGSGPQEGGCSGLTMQAAAAAAFWASINSGLV
jgi:hypothetical protein